MAKIKNSMLQIQAYVTVPKLTVFSFFQTFDKPYYLYNIRDHPKLKFPSPSGVTP